MAEVRQSLINAHKIPVAVLIAALVLAWLAYSPGIGGMVHFDDEHNLGGLADIHDESSAIQFITTGQSGPLGRPIALASFVPEAYAWPHSPDVFLRTNILIHLLNGALVVWLLYLIGKAQRRPEQEAALIGAVAGALWMLMPILASSTLMIVQRMTTLSASFVLLGLIAYLHARKHASQRPSTALVCMTLALVAGAILGAFTKENGALIFLYVLALEWALLVRPAAMPILLWRGWFAVVLLGPLVVLTWHLINYVPYPESVVLARDFTAFERLITQAEILWRYVYLSFLPNAGAFSPFHDDYVARSRLFQGVTFLAVAAWITVIAAAVTFRRRFPLFSFAVAWYLLGHILESTTVPLELYFEHRNYLPLIGPVYALAAAAVTVSGRWKRLSAVSLGAYTLLLGGVLFSVTSLWGSPTVAAEIWQLYKPSSKRAVLTLAAELQKDGYLRASRRLLERFLEANPDADGIRLQILQIDCLIDRAPNHSETVHELVVQLRTASFNYGIPDTLGRLHTMINDDLCPHLAHQDILRMSESVLQNPRYSNPIVRHNLHVLIADIGAEVRDLELTMTNLQKALEQFPNANTLRIALSVLVSAGLYQSATELLEDAHDWRPRQPVQAAQWDLQLDVLHRALQDYIERSPAYSGDIRIEP
jgi:protein O-mannosyl-transferase